MELDGRASVQGILKLRIISVLVGHFRLTVETLRVNSILIRRSIFVGINGHIEIVVGRDGFVLGDILIDRAIIEIGLFDAVERRAVAT